MSTTYFATTVLLAFAIGVVFGYRLRKTLGDNPKRFNLGKPFTPEPYRCRTQIIIVGDPVESAPRWWEDAR